MPVGWPRSAGGGAARVAADAEPTKVAVAAAPRSYRREDLAVAAAGAGIAVLPARPLAVIDGADGSVGAAALVALRRALPDATLWPIGLNAKAQVAMLNALGEAMPPAVPGNALAQAAAILGPSDILLAGSLDGDVTNESRVSAGGQPRAAVAAPAAGLPAALGCRARLAARTVDRECRDRDRGRGKTRLTPAPSRRTISVDVRVERPLEAAHGCNHPFPRDGQPR